MLISETWYKISIDIKAGRVGAVSKEDLESPILTA
jgi:hypothetical protein